MIKLVYNGNNQLIQKAICQANAILQSNSFYDKVASLPQMSNTTLSSKEIAEILKTCNEEICIQSFWNPFRRCTKMVGQNIIKVNSSKLSCTTAFAVNSIINQALITCALQGKQINFEKANFDETQYGNVFPCRIAAVAEILTRKSKLSHLKAQLLY